ncbi:pyrroloquinoline quinone biosynthesis peptide chaperone PqqD [Falsirhodobacter deserti]|uniref:pyrroloquinoline quinone biosynthesis peptide chaperone PqqD n=1 Tax=Falsirhodobacter deserti TaxID=1365611 RepID=UPI001F4EA96D|nr:pyrroloquinoline quinone biosynthesis peptide chaperone PqqD [Falsirhodobacter deserti]
MTDARIFFLPRGVRMRWDGVRGRQVLLGPERALLLDEIGHAVMAEVDGESSVAVIAGRLSRKFEAPVEVIQPDVAEFLDGLLAKRLLEVRP